MFVVLQGALWLRDAVKTATNQKDVCRLQRLHFKHAWGCGSTILRLTAVTWLSQTSAPGLTHVTLRLTHVITLLCMFVCLHPVLNNQEAGRANISFSSTSEQQQRLILRLFTFFFINSLRFAAVVF